MTFFERKLCSRFRTVFAPSETSDKRPDASRNEARPSRPPSRSHKSGENRPNWPAEFLRRHCHRGVHIQHSPNTPTTGLRERGNDTSKSTRRHNGTGRGKGAGKTPKKKWARTLKQHDDNTATRLGALLFCQVSPVPNAPSPSAFTRLTSLLCCGQPHSCDRPHSHAPEGLPRSSWGQTGGVGRGYRGAVCIRQPHFCFCLGSQRHANTRECFATTSGSARTSATGEGGGDVGSGEGDRDRMKN